MTTNVPFFIDVTIKVPTIGVSGTANCVIKYTDTASNPLNYIAAPTAATTINTTGSLLVDVQFTYSGGNAGDTFTTTEAHFELS